MSKPAPDAYTALLLVSFLAMALGASLLYLDFAAYGPSKPPSVPAPAAGR
jgi:hypothetical protein